MRLIDLEHLGRPHVIGSWLVDGILVDPGPQSCEQTLLEALGEEIPEAIALTHIHLDHAGATGSLVRRWPHLEVFVHERGARHIVSPEKLMASATRLYGERMDELWGEMVPVPQENIRVIGEEAVGPFDAAPTVGHASHHLAYLHRDSGTCFTGDVGGVRLPEGGPVVAPTPPPDIDLEAWEMSLRRIEAWEPLRIAPTHFGSYDDPADHIDGIRAWLDTWGADARMLEREQWIEQHTAWLRARLPDEATLDTMTQATPPEQCWAGLDRYWSLPERSG